MLMILLPYLPIVIAPLAAFGLVLAVRRWVKPLVPPAVAAPTAADAGLASADDSRPGPLVWADVAREANPLIAYALPILTSAAIVPLTLWPFAYLGWAIIELAPDPGWSTQVPPWFGNFGYFLGFGFAGLFLALLGAFLAVAVGFVLHVLGKCILWPALCACLGGDDDDAAATDDQTEDAP